MSRIDSRRLLAVALEQRACDDESRGVCQLRRVAGGVRRVDGKVVKLLVIELTCPDQLVLRAGGADGAEHDGQQEDRAHVIRTYHDGALLRTPATYRRSTPWEGCQ